MLQFVCILLLAVTINAQTSVNSETDVQSVLNIQVPDPSSVLPDPKTVVAKATAPKATGLPSVIPAASLPHAANLGSLPNPFGAARVPSVNAPSGAPLGAPKPANPCDAIICEDKRTCVANGDRGVCVEIKPITETEASGAVPLPKTDLVDAPKTVGQALGRAPIVDAEGSGSAAASVPKVLATVPKALGAIPPVNPQLPVPNAPKAIISKAIETVPLPKPVDGIPQVNPQATIVLTCEKLSCEEGETCEVRRGQAVCVPDEPVEAAKPEEPKVVAPEEPEVGAPEEPKVVAPKPEEPKVDAPEEPKVVAPVLPPVDPKSLIAKTTSVVAAKTNRGGDPCQVTRCAPDRTCVFENEQTACVPKVAVEASANVKATNS